MTTTADASARLRSGGRQFGKTRRLALLAERHELMLAGMDDTRWWQLRRRRARRARLLELERELGMTPTRKGQP